MLEIRNVTKSFMTGGGFLKSGRTVTALKGVSLAVRRGESFGLVGESGSGKTTLTRCILQLERVTSGQILLDGVDLGALGRRQMRRMQARVQIVFQDPYASLNPRQSVHDIICEPMEIHHASEGRRRRTERAVELLELVGLSGQHLFRYPHEFSGGQRQRIAIARAMALDPRFVMLDEPTSALDMTIQVQIVDLLRELQKRRRLAYMFISHDLRVVRALANHVLVMQDGHVVEEGSAEQIFSDPRKPYTRALLAAAFNLEAAGVGAVRE